jgi:hypothetical protein
VEISELNYDLMPWGAVNEDWFEPLAASVATPVIHLRPSLTPHLPQKVSEMDLDQAELGARLVLNQLHADTTGRLEIQRSPTAVVVKGIVETEERKQELEAHLHQVSHVIAAISSFQDIQTQPATTSQVTSVKAASVVAGVSPLERYLLDRGSSRDTAEEMLHSLFDSSVAVSQESRAISGLLSRFGTNGELSPNARNAFNELLAKHKENLLSALQQEEHVLAETGSLPAKGEGSQSLPAQERDSLVTIAARNAAICNELISDSTDRTRPAQSILSELADSIEHLRAAIQHMTTSAASSQMSSAK